MEKIIFTSVISILATVGISFLGYTAYALVNPTPVVPITITSSTTQVGGWSGSTVYVLYNPTDEDTCYLAQVSNNVSISCVKGDSGATVQTPANRG